MLASLKDPNYKPNFQLVMSDETLQRVKNYQQKLSKENGASIIGQKLNKILLKHKIDLKTEDGQTKLSNLSVCDFIDYLYQSKDPVYFPEKNYVPSTAEWAKSEWNLLRDMGLMICADIYRDGYRYGSSKGFDKPHRGWIIVGKGALIKGKGNVLVDTDFYGKKLTHNTKGESLYTETIDQEKMANYYERNLSPYFLVASKIAGAGNTEAVLTLNALGCGAFAKNLLYTHGSELNYGFKNGVIQAIAKSKGLDHIAKVHLNPWSRQFKKEEHDIAVSEDGNKTCKFVFEPGEGNPNCPAPSLPADKYIGRDGMTFSVMAGDPVGLVMNDWNGGSTSTDEGAKSSGSSLGYELYGIKGEYSCPNGNKDLGTYIPPQGYQDWRQLIEEQDLQIAVKNRIIITNTKVGSTKRLLADGSLTEVDYQQIVKDARLDDCEYERAKKPEIFIDSVLEISKSEEVTDQSQNEFAVDKMKFIEKFNGVTSEEKLKMLKPMLAKSKFKDEYNVDDFVDANNVFHIIEAGFIGTIHEYDLYKTLCTMHAKNAKNIDLILIETMLKVHLRELYEALLETFSNTSGFRRDDRGIKKAIMCYISLCQVCCGQVKPYTSSSSFFKF